MVFDRKLRWSAVAVCAVSAAQIAGCAPPRYNETAPAPAASYFPLAVGDHWTYQFSPGGKKYDCDVTSTKVIGGVTTYAMAIQHAYTYVAVRPDGVYEYAQGETEHPTNAIVFNPPQRKYMLPFVVGSDWSTPVLIDPLNPKSDVVRVYGRVETLEDVTVPAGTFKDCARVLLDDPRDTPQNVAEIWFAPNVGIIKTRTQVQSSTTNRAHFYETQLVSYKLKQ